MQQRKTMNTIGTTYAHNLAAIYYLVDAVSPLMVGGQMLKSHSMSLSRWAKAS